MTRKSLKENVCPFQLLVYTSFLPDSYFPSYETPKSSFYTVFEETVRDQNPIDW